MSPVRADIVTQKRLPVPNCRSPGCWSARGLLGAWCLYAAAGATTLPADERLEDAAPEARVAFALSYFVGDIPFLVTGSTDDEQSLEKGLAGVRPGQILCAEIGDANLNQSLFGFRVTAAGARAELNARLAEQIAAMDLACGLTPEQKQKLELAGRGDIIRFFWRVDELRRRRHEFQVREGHSPEDELMTWAAGAVRDIQPLRRAFESGPFGEGSLFDRIRQKLLSVSQQSRFDVVRDVKKLGGKITARPRGRGTDSMTEVRLSATRVNDASLACLSPATTLGSLLLDDTTISDAGLAHLKELRNLEILDLRKTRVSDAGLETLAGFSNLRSLRLEGTKITDAGLIHLKRLTRLEYLHLGGTQITGAGFVHLRELTNLQDLYLGETRIDDDALRHLQGMAALEHLSLSGTPITSAGLVHLSRFPRLQRLFLIGTDVSAASAAELNRSLPKLTIIR